MLDREVLRGLEHDLGDRVLVQEVVRTFLELLPDRASAIVTTAAAGDLAGLRRAAHALGPSSALVGCPELHDCCRELESADLVPGTGGFAQLVRSCVDACAESGAALGSWLAEDLPQEDQEARP